MAILRTPYTSRVDFFCRAHTAILELPRSGAYVVGVAYGLLNRLVTMERRSLRFFL
jgi:hypothetical protein